MKIKEREEYTWHSRTLQPKCDRFKHMHSAFRIQFVWFIAKMKPKLITATNDFLPNVLIVTKNMSIHQRMHIYSGTKFTSLAI